MYKMWQVFSENKTQFFIVNTQTRQIQSVWGTYAIAASVVSKLNAQNKAGVI